MELERLLREKREEILHICAKYGARNVEKLVPGRPPSPCSGMG